MLEEAWCRRVVVQKRMTSLRLTGELANPRVIVPVMACEVLCGELVIFMGSSPFREAPHELHNGIIRPRYLIAVGRVRGLDCMSACLAPAPAAPNGWSRASPIGSTRR